METVTSHAAFESTARKLSLVAAKPRLVTKSKGGRSEVQFSAGTGGFSLFQNFHTGSVGLPTLMFNGYKGSSTGS